MSYLILVVVKLILSKLKMKFHEKIEVKAIWLKAEVKEYERIWKLVSYTTV